MWIMLCAGAAMFLYGLATDPKVILGSFIFFGMGGLAYYSIRSRTYFAPATNPDPQDTPLTPAANTEETVNGKIGVPMSEAARRQAEKFADAFGEIAKGQISAEEREVYEYLRSGEAQAYAEFLTPNSRQNVRLSDVKASLPRLAHTAAGIVYASYSNKSFHERFDEQPMAAPWTISDALALWYSLGYFCVIAAANSVNIEQAAGTAISGATLDALIGTWKMTDNVHSKFKAFYKENLNLVWATYGAIDDAQKLRGFFSLWATRITGGTTPFVPSSISKDDLTNSVLRGEIRNADPILHIALSMEFTQVRLAIKKVIEAAVH